MADAAFLAISFRVLSQYAQRSGMLISTIERAVVELEALGGSHPSAALLSLIQDLRRALRECGENAEQARQ